MNYQSSLKNKDISFFLYLSILFIYFFSVLLNSQNSLASTDPKLLITINKFVSHPALDRAEEGFIDALNNKNLSQKFLIKQSNAQGNISLSTQIAKHHASLNPDFMIAISTPAAQSNLKAKLKNSILGFLAVTDPMAAGLSKDPNIIGIMDNPLVEDLLEITLKIMPQIKTIGIIFSPAEINSVTIIERMEKAALLKGIKIKKAALTSPANIKTAVQKLVEEVEVIYLPLDNVVISAIDGLVKEANRAKIPLISNDPILVNKGLLLALGTDYYLSGQELGSMIADMIEGNKAAGKIKPPSKKQLKINEDLAKKLNILLPEDLNL